MKVIVAIVIALITSFFIFKHYENKHSEKLGSDTSKQQFNMVEKKFPTVANNAGFQNKVEHLYLTEKQQESAQVDDLIGKVNSQFGIRDDIFDYIVKNIPQNNAKVFYYAMIFAAYDQKLFLSQNKEEAIKNLQNLQVPTFCLMKYNMDSIVTNVPKMFADNEARELQKNKVESYLAWQVIRVNYSKEELERKCNNNEF